MTETERAAPEAPPASPLSDERLAEIVRDYQEREPGFYARNGERKMATMQELIQEVLRLRALTRRNDA
jgi:hypothetical protein